MASQLTVRAVALHPSLKRLKLEPVLAVKLSLTAMSEAELLSELVSARYLPTMPLVAYEGFVTHRNAAEGIEPKEWLIVYALVTAEVGVKEPQSKSLPFIVLPPLPPV